MKKSISLVIFLLLSTAMFAQSIPLEKIPGNYNIKPDNDDDLIELILTNDNDFYYRQYDNYLPEGCKDIILFGKWQYKKDSILLLLDHDENRYTISGRKVEGMSGYRKLLFTGLHTANSTMNDEMYYALLTTLDDTLRLPALTKEIKIVNDDDNAKNLNSYTTIVDPLAKYLLVWKRLQGITVINLPADFNEYTVACSTSCEFRIVRDRLFLKNKNNKLSLEGYNLNYAKPVGEVDIQIIKKNQLERVQHFQKDSADGFNTTYSFFPEHHLSNYNDDIGNLQEDSKLTYAKSWAEALETAKNKGRQILSIYVQEKDNISDADLNDLLQYTRTESGIVLYKCQPNDKIIADYNINYSPAFMLSQNNGTLISKSEGTIPYSIENFIIYSREDQIQSIYRRLATEFKKGNRDKLFLLGMIDALPRDENSYRPESLVTQVMDTLIYYYGNIPDTSIINRILGRRDRDCIYSGLPYIVQRYKTIQQMYRAYNNEECDTVSTLLYLYCLNSLEVTPKKEFNHNKSDGSVSQLLFLQWLQQLRGFEYHNAMMTLLNYFSGEEKYNNRNQAMETLIHNYLNEAVDSVKLNGIIKEIDEDLSHTINGRENLYVKVLIYDLNDDTNTSAKKASLQDNWTSSLIRNLNNCAWNGYKTEKGLSQCIKCSKKSLDMAPDNPYYLDTYAHLLYKTSSKTEAIKYQTRAVLNTKKGLITEGKNGYSLNTLRTMEKELLKMKNGTLK